jgi:hypothetical protein
MPFTPGATAAQNYLLGKGHHTYPGASRPGTYFHPTAAEPRAGWERDFRDRENTRRNFLLGAFDTGPMASLPLIFSRRPSTLSRKFSLPRRTDGELMSYAAWARSCSGSPTTTDEEVATNVLSVALQGLLASDYRWRANKQRLPDVRDMDAQVSDPNGAAPVVERGDEPTGRISIPGEPSSPPRAARKRGRPPRNSQAAPLAFMCPEGAVVRDCVLPLATSTELDAYVAWLVRSHNLPAATLMRLTIERAVRLFLKRDSFWLARRA